MTDNNDFGDDDGDGEEPGDRTDASSTDAEQEPTQAAKLRETASVVVQRARDAAGTVGEGAARASNIGLQRAGDAARTLRERTEDADPREWVNEHRRVAGGVALLWALFSAIAVLLVVPPLWRYGLLAFAVGILPGVTLFPWITSPFGPGLWVLSTPFARIHFTISQVIRKVGVLVKRSSNDYEFGTFVPEDEEAIVSDGRVPVDEASTRWGLFGKRKLGLTWEFGTDVYERITVDQADESQQRPDAAVSDASGMGDAVADGRGRVSVSLNAAHRLFRGVNEAETITRTKEHAEAEYGGGDDDLGGLMMALLVMLMLLLGSATTYLML